MPRVSGAISMPEGGTLPSNSTGRGLVYFKSDGKLYCKSSGGTEYDLTDAGLTTAPSNMVTTDTTQTISGAKTFSSNVTVGSTLTLANPGVGVESVVNFAKSSDSASIRVTETVSDQTHYAFFMSDNPDANDAFAWQWSDWSNPGSGWTPLYMNGINTTFSAKTVTINGDLAVGTHGFVTSAGGPHGNRDFLRTTAPLKTGTGTVNLTVDASGYTGTTGQSFWVKIEAGATTFQWGYGSNHTSPVTQQTALPLATTATTLSNGIKVTFSATTGAVAGDVWTMRAFRGGTITAPQISVTSEIWTARGSATNVPYGFSDNGNTGMWSAGADQLNFATGGTDRIALTTTAETHTLPTTFNSTATATAFLASSDGTAAAPAFRFGAASNTGVYSPTTDQLALSVGGTARVTLTTTTETHTLATTFSSTLLSTTGVYDGASAIAANRVYSVNNKVPVGGLSTTGTPSASTFLRGDMNWAGVVTSNVAGTGISVSSATGAVTVTNTGVTSIVAGTNVTISGATGAVTVNASAPSNMVTTDTTQTISGAKTFSSEIIGPATGNVLKIGDDARLADINIAHYSGIVSQTDTTQGGWAFGSGAGAFRILGNTSGAGTITGNVTITGTTNSTGNLSENGSRVYSVNNKVPVAGISATGTPSATTYLRGDGSWATVSGSGSTSTDLVLPGTAGTNWRVSVDTSNGQLLTTSTTDPATVAFAEITGGSSYYQTIKVAGVAQTQRAAANWTVSGSGIQLAVTDDSANNETDFVLSNTGVTSIVAGTNVTISGGTGAVTVNAPSPANMATTDSAQTISAIKTFSAVPVFPAGSYGAVTAQTSFGASSGNGSASTFARSDHTHGTPSNTNVMHLLPRRNR